MKVAVLDAFAALDFDLLKTALEAEAITKVVHNSAFDVPRLAKHYAINAAPVFDTMRAARFNGERKYSLAAQSNAHLDLHLDKSVQKSDWSRRPLSAGQLYYAAVDAYTALLLYENQTNWRLTGCYQKKPVDSRQIELPLADFPEANAVQTQAIQSRETVPEKDLSDLSLALLGIVSELPTRFSPDALAVSIGSSRVGMAGWIIDRRLGADADLYERQFVQMNETRRLIATSEGIKCWREFKDG